MRSLGARSLRSRVRLLSPRAIMSRQLSEVTIQGMTARRKVGNINLEERSMKKTVFAIIASAAAILASCSKVESTTPNMGAADITFDVADFGAETKAIKSSWEDGDEIMIMFYEKTENGQQARLRYESGSWTVIQKPEGLGLSTGETIQYNAFCSVGEITYDKSATKRFSYVGGPVRKTDGWVTSGAVLSDGTIPLGTISLNKKLYVDEFQVVIPGISAADKSYNLCITCNGAVRGAGSLNYSSNSTPSAAQYSQSRYPSADTTYGEISFGGGWSPVPGAKNTDGVVFTMDFNDCSSSDAATASSYKYVFSLSDGTNLYYYTIAKDSSLTLAAGKAIKLPTFDGTGAKTYWKTSL